MDKAAHYFGLTITHVPVGPDYKADVKAMEKVGVFTIMVVTSRTVSCGVVKRRWCTSARGGGGREESTCTIVNGCADRLIASSP
jgi:hypothetical protein